MRSWRLHDFITGAPIGPRLKASGNWSMSMTAVGQGTHAILLRTPALAKLGRAFWRDATSHWARVLVECWDGNPQYAGLIKHRRMRAATGEVILRTVTPDHLLNDRYVHGVGDFPTAEPFTITGASLRSAVERTIKRVSGDLGPKWVAPYRYSHLAEGGAFSLAVDKFEWKRAADIIASIRKSQGGPDLAFVPAYNSAEHLVWDILTGTPRVPGVTLDLPMSVRGSRASFPDIDEDGSNMGSGIFGRGEGYDRKQLIGLAGYFNGLPVDAPPMIVRDFVTNFPGESDQTAVNSRTQQYLDDNTWPVRQWGYDLNVTSRINLPALPPGDLKLGTRLHARYSGNELFDPIDEMHYIVALSHSTDRPNVYPVEVQKL